VTSRVDGDWSVATASAAHAAHRSRHRFQLTSRGLSRTTGGDCYRHRQRSRLQQFLSGLVVANSELDPITDE